MLATPELTHEPARPARLAERVPEWLRRVPAYQSADYAGNGGAAGDLTARFTRLPFLSKADIRRGFPHNFLPPGAELADLIERGAVELEHTSGTSGERVPLLLARGWWAIQEERALRLNPLVASVLDEHPRPRRVTLTSPACNNDVCYTGRPSPQERVVGHTLHASLSRHPFLWSEAELARMAGEAVEWKPIFLDVDPVYGSVFARYCERRGVRLPSLRFVLSSYEFLSVCHRRSLERAFGVPVLNLYGSTETGHLLMERGPLPGGAEIRSFLPSHETAHLEVVRSDAAGIGELIVTTLDNDYMPLIRYRIGDLVERRDASGQTIYLLHGRQADALTGGDGRRVTVAQVDACFEAAPGVAHYQVTGASGGEWRLQFVPEGTGPAPAVLRALTARLGELLGSKDPWAVVRTDALLAEPSGKFRLCRPRQAADFTLE